MKRRNGIGLGIGLALIAGLYILGGGVLVGRVRPGASARPARITVTDKVCPSSIQMPAWTEEPNVLNEELWNDLTHIAWPVYIKSPTDRAQV